MTAYRMKWPVLDPRLALADLLGQAMQDLRAALTAEDVTQAGPVSWSLTPTPHLTLVAVVPVAAPTSLPAPTVPTAPETPAPAATARPVAPCGTRAAYMRHRSHGETPCGPCRDAERDYQAARHLRRRAARLEQVAS